MLRRFEELSAVTFRNVIQAVLGRGLETCLSVVGIIYTIRRIYMLRVLSVEMIYMVDGDTIGGYIQLVD